MSRKTRKQMVGKIENYEREWSEWELQELQYELHWLQWQQRTAAEDDDRQVTATAA